MKSDNFRFRNSRDSTNRRSSRRIVDSRLRARHRKGVLLLVVLGMLTLFLMIGTAFVVSSNQYRRANKSYAKFGEKENLRIAQEEFLGEVINQLIRDTTNQNSALRFHSLLRDLYGTEGFRGEVLVPQNNNECVALAAKYAGAPGGTTDAEVYGPVIKQFIEFAVYDSPIVGDTEQPLDLFGNPINLNTMPDYYAGQVLTWTSGPLEGTSTRIVKSRYDATLGYTILTVVASPTHNDALLTPFRGAVNSTRTPELTQLATVQQGVNYGAEFIVNGRPFNGTGVGYNSQAAVNEPKLNAYERIDTSDGTNLSVPIALAPNAAFFDPHPNGSIVFPRVSGTIPYYYGTPATPPVMRRAYDGIGGSDESYDAPDFQNMFLAWTGPSVQDTIFTSLDSTPNPDPLGQPFSRDNLPPYLGNIVLPSFHRPDLLNYWRDQLLNLEPALNLGQDNAVSLLRKIMLRPNWHDHPDFDGSNPEFAQAKAYAEANNTPDQLLRMIYGPWDVDNDNDGVRDSVWIDFGAPVMIGANGRLVKPLAAVMVLDLDGRLNVNAHGTRDIQNPTNFGLTFAGGVNSNNVPKGQAFGVAEISLRPVVGNRFGVLLNGDNIYGTFYPGRYAANDNEPGAANRFDLSAQLKTQGLPAYVYGTNALARSNYGSLPDLRARYAMGLNDFGQSVLEWNNLDYVDRDTSGTFTVGDEARLDEDSPYELDLSSTGPRGKGTSVDNPYSATELERLLRMFDIDAGSLSPRLFELLKGGRPQNISPSDPNYDQLIAQYNQDLKNYRTLLTTDSYDLPEPGVQLPAWVRLGPDGVKNSPNPKSDDFDYVMGRQPVNATFADLIEYRLRIAQDPIWSVADDTLPANSRRLPALRKRLRMLVAPEMLAGLKLDMNRPFGNGRDDNNNGVVDEPGEYYDANSNGQFDTGEREAAFWQVDSSRLSANEAGNPTRTAFEDGINNDVDSNAATEFGAFRDHQDRNSDGQVHRWERGDYLPDNAPVGTPDASDGDDNLSQIELVHLHNYRRQLLARHLYVLAMAVVDPIPNPSGDPTNAAYVEKKRDRARQLAQWAINAVDIRDPDNIMTAFEYDEDPFLRAWFVDPTIANPVPIDGNPNTTIDVYGANGKYDPPSSAASTSSANRDTGGLVWGSEKPEVLMTETLAWHDRRTEDGPREKPDADESDPTITSHEGGSTDYPADSYDRSFDQRERPIGAAFVELYNPSAPMPGASADTHFIDGAGNDLGINLAAVSQFPRNNVASPEPDDFSPVWRLAVYQTRQVTLTTDGVTRVTLKNIAGPDKDPDDLDNNNIPTTIDRSVYFTGFDPGYNRERHGVAFYNSRTDLPATLAGLVDNRVLPLRPGRYMVVGAGKEVAPGKYLANFGTKTTVRQSPRGIQLSTRPTANEAPVELLGASGTVVDDPAGFQVRSLTQNEALTVGLPAIPGDNRQTFADVAIIDRFTDPRPGANPKIQTRPFNISEPAGGYPKRWAGSALSANGQYGPDYIDIPLDDQRTVLGAGGGIGGGGGGDGGGIGAPPATRKPKTDPLVDGEYRLSLPGQVTTGGGGGIGGGGGGSTGDPEQARRTIPGFSWIYLQRLANPLLAWNPLPTLPNGTINPDYRSDLPVNPYLTVDSMGANVTVFNGLKTFEALRTSPDADPLEFRNSRASDTFASVQRGRANVAVDPAIRLGDLQSRALRTGGRSLPPVDPDRPPPANASQAPQNLWSTEGLGISSTRVAGYFKNKAGTGNGAEAGALASPHNFNAIPDNTLGFLNEPFRSADPARARVVPEQPFSWLTWNNRPYANPAELMQVPAFRSSRLLSTYSFLSPRSTNPKVPNREVYYEGRAVEIKYSNTLKWIVDGPYNHLLNFFRTRMHPGEDTNSNTVDDEGIAGLFRVLDFVSVPSLYVGSETWLSPGAFGATTPTVTNVADPRYGLQPPFNRLASRRDPGRVNINTVAAEAVWNALFHGDVRPDPDNGTHPGPSDNDLPLTRRGYQPGDKDPTYLNAAYPTLFVNPFRSASAGDLVPIQIPNPPPPQQPTLMISEGVDCTLLRTTDRTAGSNPPSPPFCATAVIAPAQAYRNSPRNPYFRWSPISRLSSMTTTRSNVFAVWVTVGFFEVEEINQNDPVHQTILARFGPQKNGTLADARQDPLFHRVYPDGFLFGKEAGIDTGQTVRYREFAIIDRTIPVAFEPGADHNVQEMIRLRRKIE